MSTLTDQELNRYNRQIILPALGIEGQEKLKAAKVLVAGAGGLGCPVLLYLAAAGVGTIAVVDFDTVNVSNLHRQVLYNDEDIGFPKAERAAMHLRNQNPLVNIIAYNERLSVRNSLGIFSQFDLVIDCTDNFSTRYMINDACVLLNLPFIYGAVSGFSAQVSVFNYNVTGKDCPTYRCAFPVPPAQGSVKSCEEAGIPGVTPGIAGLIQATEAIKIITGIGKVLSGEILHIDTTVMTFTNIRLKRDESVWKNMPSNKEIFLSMDYDFFCGESLQDANELSAAEFNAYLANSADLTIIDVREKDELVEDLLPNSEHIPLNVLENKMNVIDPSKVTIIVCATGKRSSVAVGRLKTIYPGSKIYSLRGGIKGLKASGKFIQ
jgi:sulfur-carrier protein adenylyltransferase/sulfurtransferase